MVGAGATGPGEDAEIAEGLAEMRAEAEFVAILVMENGTLVEQGTHESLLSRDQAYSRLWEQQLFGDVEKRATKRRGVDDDEGLVDYGRVGLHSDTSGVHGGAISIQSLRATDGIDQTLSGGGRGAGGSDEGGWLW